MTTAVVSALDRLLAVTSDPETMEVVGQRVMEGETLKAIARSWELPVMKFVSWVIEDLARLQVYEAALRVRADEMAHQTVAIADAADAIVVKDDDGKDHVIEPDARRDALRVKTRLQLAGHWDRERYGRTSVQDVNLNVRRVASEMSDEELLALIARANDQARAIEGQSTRLLVEQSAPTATAVYSTTTDDGLI